MALDPEKSAHLYAKKSLPTSRRGFLECSANGHLNSNLKNYSEASRLMKKYKDKSFFLPILGDFV
jgi:hypothetical protein